MARLRLKSALAACAAALLTGAGGTVHGDDTEVYIGIAADQDNVNPNVLFVIDTSGSMDTEVTITTDYDSNATYSVPSGNPACSDDDNVFYSENANEPPGCNSSNRFDNSGNALVCDKANQSLFSGVNVTGRYTDQIGVWGNYFWQSPSWRDFPNPNFAFFFTVQHVECEDEKGIHGATAGGPAYPVNSGGPFQSSKPTGQGVWQSWPTRTLFSAHYLRWYWYHKETNSQTRLSIVQDVAKDLVDSVSEINIGLMRFDTTGGDFEPTHSWFGDRQGGLVVYPMKDIDAAGIRAEFKDAVDDLNADGYTPLAETLYEAMLYYRGQNVKYGRGGTFGNGRWSHSGSRNGGTYITPINYECSRNYVVFLTDGLPNTDNDADDEINPLLATTSDLDLGTCDNGDDDPIDNCLNELSEYMFKTDSATALLGNDLVGTQNITTYTVGFNVDDDGLLESTAEKGGGEFHTANTAQQLTNAFTQIIENILRVNTTFTSPAVSVNAFNRLTHRNELYFAVFQPDDRPHWPGNIKKFKIDFITDGGGNRVDADGDGENDIAIFDANGNPAVSESTGFFTDNARSFWTPDDFAPDGTKAGSGGMASRLYDYSDNDNQHDPDSRDDFVYTFTGSVNGGQLVTNLTNLVNKLHEDNAYIAGTNDDGKLTKAMFGAPSISDSEFLKLIKWARGLDITDEDEDGVTTDGRPTVGAPLHTRPHLVTYHIDDSNNAQDDILFVVTNDGYLHMVPTTDPTGSDTPAGGARLENWTFMPPDKLTNIKPLYQDLEASNILYGLDGGIDIWVNDANNDLDILDDSGNVDTGDHAYLYFGQRRGGRNYYGLDVSDPSSPEYLWRIDGDAALFSDPLARLGQTWSRPRHTKVFFKEGSSSTLTEKDVLIFGGGYDATQDSVSTRTADAVGNAVFIVDATTGAVLWWAGDTPVTGAATPDLALANMDYGIPGDIRVIDINGDGVMDRFFASDMGGQVWRFDIANDSADTLANRITGGRIADLQKTSAAATAPGDAANRRFYYPPDVALIVPEEGKPYHSISVGSGFRAHPNNTVINDRIYVIKDYDITSPPKDGNGAVSYSTRYEGGLLDVTAVSRTDIPNLTDDQLAKLEAGWFIRLTAAGEKALASALTVDGKVLVTTFIPADQTAANLTDVCAPSEGSARLYALNAENGLPVANLDGQGDSTAEAFTLSDRFYDLTRRGIAPEVTIIFPEDGSVSPIPIVGTELIPELKIDNDPESTYWYQENVH